jgi:hypothetical protein
MEKIILRPKVKELVYKGGEPDVYFDALSYHGSTLQEKGFGSLLVLCHIKQKDEELSYFVNLISSLARREFYSPESMLGQDPRTAFERTLKKLNEVLDDFFKNKDFVLNLGLAVIAGENVYLSKLGKFKVALARDGEYIDVLNNIGLFKRDESQEKKFSNIISGHLKPGDKLFAYFPTKPIASREKTINPLFVSTAQNEFSEKISALASNASNFSCCGLHVSMEQTREIPIVKTVTRPLRVPEKVGPAVVETPSGEKENKNKRKEPLIDVPVTPKPTSQDETPTVIKVETETDQSEQEEPAILKPQPQSSAVQKAIGSELAYGSRKSFLGTGLTVIGKTLSSGRMIKFLALVAIIVSGVIWYTNRGGSGKDSGDYNAANASFKIAQTKIGENDQKAARDLMRLALAQIGSLQNKQSNTLRGKISNTLDSIDKITSTQPELIYNNDGKGVSSQLVASVSDLITAVDSTGKIYQLSNGSLSQKLKLAGSIKLLVGGVNGGIGVAADGALSVFNLKDDKNASYVSPYDQELANKGMVDASIYENNLYAIFENSIYKQADAVLGKNKVVEWGKVEGVKPISLSVDGDIFVLDAEGMIAKYFKGAKETEFNSDITPGDRAKIYTAKDLSSVYLLEPDQKRVFVFDKTSGDLLVGYKLDVVGDITDISIAPSGSILILSSTGNIWQIKP